MHSDSRPCGEHSNTDMKIIERNRYGDGTSPSAAPQEYDEDSMCIDHAPPFDNNDISQRVSVMVFGNCSYVNM